MNRFLAFALGSTALVGIAMTEPAQAADFEPDPTYTWAGTAYLGGGASWLDFSFGGDVFVKCVGSCDAEINHIVGGGDFVLPLYGNWNLQLGGGFHIDHQNFSGGGSDTTTQFQGGAIGFWRDPTLGVFGLEAGLFSPFGNESPGIQNSFKIGGVAQYFFGDMITFGAFGGALFPIQSSFRGKSFDTGFYAGGDVTYYASDTVAVAGFARFLELGSSSRDPSFSDQTRELNVGGRVRYLTSMPGVELFASGSYRECRFETTSELNFTSTGSGAQVLGGVNIRLGGFNDSLVAIDRSNAIDTRAWTCTVD